MNKHNYLHLSPRYYPYIGGSENYIKEIGERLAAEENQCVTVYATDAWDLEYFWRGDKKRIDRPNETLNNVQIKRFPVRRFPIISPLYYPAMRRLINIVSSSPLPDKAAVSLMSQMGRTTPLVPALSFALNSKKSPKLDLIHVTNITFDSLIYDAAAYAKRNKAALVITPFVHLGEPHDPLVRKYYTMRHQINWLKQADLVLTMTSLERDFLAQMGVPEKKMRVVGVGVEPEEMVGGDAAAFRNKHKISGPIVAFQGAIAFDKGANHVVQAMQKIWRENKGAAREATLVLAGPPLSQFEKFYQELPESDRANIRYLGFISPQEKKDLFAAADIMAMPSRTDSFGIVYLEAWLKGKPVIGVRAGGVPAVIGDGADGFLIDFGDVDDLAAKIAVLLEDKTLATRMGAAGLAKVEQNYTWTRVYAKIRQAYAEALGEEI